MPPPVCTGVKSLFCGSARVWLAYVQDDKLEPLSVRNMEQSALRRFITLAPASSCCTMAFVLGVGVTVLL